MENVVKVAELEGGYELVKSEDYAYTLYVRTPENELIWVRPRTTISINGRDYKAIELFKMGFPDDFYRAYYEVSERTKKYIDKVKEFIGLESNYSTGEQLHPEVEKLLSNSVRIKRRELNTFNVTIEEIYEIPSQNKYVVIYYSSSFDTFSTTAFVFNKYPSEKDIKTALNIEYIEFMLSRVRDKRRCCECGEVKSFVEFSGRTLEQKIKSWEKRVCEKCCPTYDEDTIGETHDLFCR